MKFYLSSFHLGEKPEQLVKLLGDNKKAGVIQNAVDNASEDKRKAFLENEFADLKNLGIMPEELDLRNYFGKKEDLGQKVSKYGMVWVTGGNTFTLRRAYFYSGFDEILKEKLSDKDFVYGGYSAGICVLAPSLKGLDIVDNPNVVPLGYKPEIIWDGLGFVDYAFSPHYRSDHPESAEIEKEVEYMIQNNIPYKTLHDGEVLILEI